MANETETSDVAVVVSQLPPMPLVALTPTEMVAAQNSLGEWCDEKIKILKHELADAKANVKSAKEHKWKSSAFESLVVRIQSRLTFYEKVRQAVDHGYLVIPNFPIEAFAVRRAIVEGRAPQGNPASASWNVPRLDAQAGLHAGIGDYTNPQTSIMKCPYKDPAGKELIKWFRHSHNAVEFPVTIARAKIIDQTQKAMALRIFDRIGLVGPERKKDPIVVGQIFRKEGWREQTLTFFIAWWFNWEML